MGNINVSSEEFNYLYTHLQATVTLDLYIAEHGQKGKKYKELTANYLKAYMDAFNYYDAEPRCGRPKLNKK